MGGLIIQVLERKVEELLKGRRKINLLSEYISRMDVGKREESKKKKSLPLYERGLR